MKIVGSDYDGTMFVDGEFKDSLVQAIKEFRKVGHKFGIVTGRSVKTLKRQVQKYDIEVDFLISNNGGIIMDKEFNVLMNKDIKNKHTKNIVDTLLKTKTHAISLNTKDYRSRKTFIDGFDEHTILKNEESIRFEEMLETLDIAQIVAAYEDQEVANKTAALLNEQFSNDIEAYANVGCVDIVPKGCSKAMGMQYIMGIYGFEKDDMYAIGDSFNDESMIREFHGATLTNAPQAIKDVSEYIVEDVETFLKIVDCVK